MHVATKRIVVAFLLLALTLGCGAHRLKQAQDSYNQAARIEARASLEEEASTGDPLQGDAQALRNYRVALALTDEALDRYAGGLRKDRLYGTALMLKALCEWRIAALDRDADPDQVQAVVAEIEHRVRTEGIVLGTRDRVLLKALPGLREHALGLHQREPEKAGALFESALDTFERALKEGNPPADHPVRAYIRLAQMRTVRAWRCADLPNRPREAAARTQWYRAWKDRYETYKKRIAPLMEANPGLKARVREMDKDFGN